MTSATASMTASPFCAVAAAAAAQDPIGSANSIDRVILFEMRLPWRDEDRQANPDGTLSQRVRAIQREHLLDHLEVPASGHIYSYAIAPDERWSVPGKCRLIIARRARTAASRYRIEEYLVPEGETALLELVRAYFYQPDEMQAFDAYRVPDPLQQQVLVCTQGSVDVCCARLGIPVYQQSARLAPGVRIWRAMHFGGHRFAPTAWELSSGYKWGFLDRDSLAQVIAEQGDHTQLLRRIRGWSGASAQAQVLDREGFRAFGWRWFDYKRAGEVVAEDVAGQAWQVRLDYEAPEGAAGSFEARVTVGRMLANTGCGPNLGSHPDSQSPEYQLQALVHRS